MIAFDADTGEERWHRNRSGESYFAFGGLHGDTLIATRFPCSDDLEYRDHEVLGLDVGTGQVRWRRNAHLLDGGQGTNVLVTRGGTLSALDTETGETDWSTDIPADVGGNATPDLALVPSPDTDGGAAVVAYARSSGRRQWVFPPGAVPLEGRWNFAVAGDRRRVVVSSYGARSDPSVPD
jgi:outer membrane protein assembly factor BamB